MKKIRYGTSMVGNV